VLAHLHAGAGIAVCTRISYEDHALQPNSLVETETLLTCTGKLLVMNVGRDSDCSD